jgi:hypothetical protein
MQRNLLISQASRRRIIALCLMAFTVLSSVFIFIQPSYAVTSSRDKLSSEERTERAYDFRVGTGFLEEDKQESPQANKVFKPEDKANEKSVKASDAQKSERSLVEQAKDFVNQVTGKD